MRIRGETAHECSLKATECHENLFLFIPCPVSSRRSSPRVWFNGNRISSGEDTLSGVSSLGRDSRRVSAVSGPPFWEPLCLVKSTRMPRILPEAPPTTRPGLQERDGHRDPAVLQASCPQRVFCFALFSILHKMRLRQLQLPLIQQLRPGGRCR